MRILIVQTGFIGDLVLSLSTISTVREHFPGAFIAVVVTPVGAELVHNDSRIDEVIIFDKRGANSGIGGFLRMSSLIRSKQFTHALSLHKSARSTLLLLISGIRYRVGFAESALSFLHNRVITRRHHAHEVQRNLCIVAGLGLPLASCSSKLKLAIPEVDRVPNRIAIAAGSVWRTKRWSTSGFVDLSKRLIDRGFELVFVGGPADKEVTDRICRQLPSGSAIRNEVGKCSLSDSAALIGSSQLLIGNDSAPLHLASATGTPAVGIYCATIPEYGFTPWMVPHRIVGEAALSCRPCGRHGGNECPTGTHLCRRGLKSDAVYAAVDDLLREVGSDAH